MAVGPITRFSWVKASVALALGLSATPVMAAERLSSGADSTAALLWFVLVALISSGLAATRAGWHRAAVVLVGLFLLAGAASLWQVQSADYFMRLVPPETPIDAFKVPVLRTTIWISAVIGLGLLAVAVRMKAPAPYAPIGLRNETARFGSVSRFLHWSIALIFISLMPMGVLMSGLPEGDTLREPLYIVHKSLGMTLLLLVAVRVIWYFVSRPPVIASDLGKFNRIGAKTAHIMLYVLMIAFPVTGYFMSSYAGKVVPFYYGDLPQWLVPSQAAAMPFGALHKFFLPVLFYLIFAAHVAGVFKHHFLDGKKDAIRRISG